MDGEDGQTEPDMENMCSNVVKVLGTKWRAGLGSRDNVTLGQAKSQVEGRLKVERNMSRGGVVSSKTGSGTVVVMMDRMKRDGQDAQNPNWRWK